MTNTERREIKVSHAPALKKTDCKIIYSFNLSISSICFTYISTEAGDGIGREKKKKHGPREGRSEVQEYPWAPYQRDKERLKWTASARPFHTIGFFFFCWWLNPAVFCFFVFHFCYSVHPSGTTLHRQYCWNSDETQMWRNVMNSEHSVFRHSLMLARKCLEMLFFPCKVSPARTAVGQIWIHPIHCNCRIGYEWIWKKGNEETNTHKWECKEC